MRIHSVPQRSTMVFALPFFALTITGCYQGLQSIDSDTHGSGPNGSEPDGSGDSGGGDHPTTNNPTSAQPMHRLNRLEYNNTVRDLLGTELRPADSFSPDPVSNGFDNMAEQLGLSAELLNSYSNAAQKAVTDALSERPAYLATISPDQLEVDGDGGTSVGSLWRLAGNTATVEIDIPQEGEYVLILRAATVVIGNVPDPTARLEMDGETLGDFLVGGTATVPAEHVYPITLSAGRHTVTLSPTNYANATGSRAQDILVSSIVIHSEATTEGPGRELVYTCDPSGANASACEQEIIATFASRAWRRPIRDNELSGLMTLLSTHQTAGESAESALHLVLRAVMTSPKFFYRARTIDDTDSEQWLDGYALASRLSYFLWSSMPDKRLFAAAQNGSLATDEGLSDAVTWMLADPKAQALRDGFGEQWLSTRYLATVSPDPEIYPEFDEDLRQAMVEESKHFFGDFIDNGLPITAMVQPEFAYLNDRLADHYGVAPVGSTEFTRVPVTGQDRRGLLALSAWLTTQSDASHSSPIRRGLWVAERLLCKPVPPPPPGLDVEPAEGEDDLSVREQLENHRTDPTCASCHALLDVIGIGFEEYDGIGRRLGNEVEVDNLGELPDGRTFEGGAELATLYANSEEFAGCLAQKLFTYAHGRPVQSSDTPLLRDISAQIFAEQGDLTTLIDAIVHTPAFRAPAAFDGAE